MQWKTFCYSNFKTTQTFLYCVTHNHKGLFMNQLYSLFLTALLTTSVSIFSGHTFSQTKDAHQTLYRIRLNRCPDALCSNPTQCPERFMLVSSEQLNIMLKLQNIGAQTPPHLQDQLRKDYAHIFTYDSIEEPLRHFFYTHENKIQERLRHDETLINDVLDQVHAEEQHRNRLIEQALQTVDETTVINSQRFGTVTIEDVPYGE